MTENILSKSQYKEFSLWVIDFEHSRLGKKAIDALKGIYGDYSPELQDRFKVEVLRACYYAFIFWHIGDVNSEKRTLLRDVSSLSDGLHERVANLVHEIDFLRCIYDAIMMEGLREAMREEYGELPADPELWNELNKAKLSRNSLIYALETYRVGVFRLQEGFETLPLRDECWINGNMLYPERIDGTNQHQTIKAATCLMFQLAIFFRLWTHPKGQKLFDKKRNLNIAKDGTIMPKEGLRHDKIITDFINTTFANRDIAIKLENPRDDAKYHKLDSLYSVSAITARIEKIDTKIRLIPWTDKSFDITLVVSEKAAKTVAKHFAKRTQKTA
jgi:hypothetical protein